MKKRFDLSRLMKRAWVLYRRALKKGTTTFSEALKAAWTWIKVQTTNTAKVEATAAKMGIEEEYHSWSGWREIGRQVIHTATATFQVEVLDPGTKSGTRVKSYFLYSDTQPLPA